MKRLYRVMLVMICALMLIPATATSPDFSRDVLQWRASLTTNANRLHRDVFPGIDLFYTGDTKTISSVFIVRPDGDPASIRLEFPTAAKSEIDNSGNVLVRTNEGSIRILQPNIHQNVNNQNQSVAGKFSRLDDKQLSVQIESYNKSLPLVIQFSSIFSTSTSASIENPNSPLAVTITATLKDSLAGDANHNGIVNPGDTLRYIVSITNSGTDDATGVSFADVVDTSTVPVAGTLTATPLAINDTYGAVYNTTLNVVAPGVLTNDTGLPAPTATPITSGPTNQSGTVTLNADGSFGYTPPTNYFGPDTFSYTATNSVGSDAAIAAITIPPPAPVATNDNYTASGNIQVAVTAPGVLDNDQLYGATITASSTTSTQGGNVAVNADGSFTYDPPAGYEGSDTFTYTVTNATSNSVGTVTMTVNGMIWFINNAAGAGDGRLSSPFNSISAFQALNDGTGNNPAANDNIFVYESGSNYVGPITLLSGQKLIGQDATATLSSLSGVTPPSGSLALPAMNSANSTIVNITTSVAATNAIALGTGNTVRGLTVGATTGAKIIGNTFGTLTLGNNTSPDVTLSGNGQALNLTTGTFAATSALVSLTSTSSTGAGVSLTTVGGTVAFGSTTLSGITTQGILVSGSTVTANFGNTSVTGGTDAISLQNNSSGVRTFGTITTSGNSAVGFLHAVGGGSTSLNGAVTITNPGGTGIDINASTTALAFPATVVNKSSTAGTCVNLTSNGVTMNFTSLTVTASNGSGLVGTNNTATITVSAGSNTATGGPAINITAATTTPLSLAFSSITSTNSTTTGVNLSNTTGTLTGSGGTISGATGTAFNISGGTIGVTYSGGITQPNNAATVMVSGGHATGTVTFQTGTLSATNGTGLQFDNADGTYNFNGTNTMNGAAASVAIFNGSAGTFSFSSNTSITNPNGGPAVNIIGGTAAVTYSGNITMSSQVQPLVSVSGGHATGTVTFNTGTLNATMGTGLQFDNADAAYNFNGTTTLNGGDAGIDILNGSGGTFNFAVASGSIAITSPTGTAFNIGGTANTAAVTYTGGITKNNAGLMVSIVNHATGTVTFQTGTLSAGAGSGLYFDNADATYNFNGTTTLNGGSAAVNIVNGSAGAFTFPSTTTITSPADTAFAVIGGTASVTYSGNITQANNFPMVCVSAGHTTGTITFQTGTLSATNGTGLQFDNADSPTSYNFNGTTTLNGGDAGIDISNGSAGAFTFASGSSITNPTNEVIKINGSSGNVTYSGSFLKNNNTITGLSVNAHSTGTITVNGTGTKTLSTGSATALTLTNNTGATINFSGNNLLLTTTSGVGFNATGGGTISVAGTGNVITSTTGTALNVANTTIGGSNLNFQSLSHNGGNNGIVLNTTGSSGGLTVTGIGTTLGSGGEIQNTTGGDNGGTTPQGTGILLLNTSNVSLSNMRIHDHSNYGIRGTNVTGFITQRCRVDGVNGTNVASPFNDGSLRFDQLLGTCSITNSRIQGGYQRNINIDNQSGTLNLTMTADTIMRSSDAAGDDGVLIEAELSANVTVSISNSYFARHGGDHINLSLINSATMNATISNNVFHGNYSGTPEGVHPIGLGQGIFILGASYNGNFTYNITGNNLKGTKQGGAIHVNKGSGTATFSGSVTNNTIGDAAIAESGASESSGIIIAARGAGGTHISQVTGNIIHQTDEMGINLEVGEDSDVSVTLPPNPAGLQVTVSGNTVDTPGPNALHGIHLNSGVLPGDNNTSCVHIFNNSIATGGNEGGGGFDMRIRQRQATRVNLPGYGGTAFDNAAAQSYFQANNPTATSISAASNNNATVVTDGYFNGGANCQLP